MTAAIAAGQPLFAAWLRGFRPQLLIWFGFLLAYQIARGVADRDPTMAFANGWRVIDIEQRLTGLGELTLQGWTQSSHLLETLVSWTYWNSEFTVIGLALLWVYLRRNGAFTRFRNTILHRERARPDRLRAPADGAAADVPVDRLRRHALAVRRPQPRQRPDRARIEPVRGDAEPPRRRRADRRHRPRLRRQASVLQGDVAAVARLGLVRRHGDRQPLLARRARGHRPRSGHDARRLPAERPGASSQDCYSRS